MHTLWESVKGDWTSTMVSNRDHTCIITKAKIDGWNKLLELGSWPTLFSHNDHIVRRRYCLLTCIELDLPVVSCRRINSYTLPKSIMLQLFQNNIPPYVSVAISLQQR